MLGAGRSLTHPLGILRLPIYFTALHKACDAAHTFLWLLIRKGGFLLWWVEAEQEERLLEPFMVLCSIQQDATNVYQALRSHNNGCIKLIKTGTSNERFVKVLTCTKSKTQGDHSLEEPLANVNKGLQDQALCQYHRPDLEGLLLPRTHQFCYGFVSPVFAFIYLFILPCLRNLSALNQKMFS